MGNRPAAAADAASAPQFSDRVELISDPSKKGTIIPQPQNQGGASNDGITRRVHWDSGEIESIGENLIQPEGGTRLASGSASGSGSASASASASVPAPLQRSPSAGEMAMAGSPPLVSANVQQFINAGLGSSMDIVCQLESAADVFLHDFKPGDSRTSLKRPRGGKVRAYDILEKLGTLLTFGGHTLKASKLLSEGYHAAEGLFDCEMIGALHQRGTPPCAWDGTLDDLPEAPGYMFEDGRAYTAPNPKEASNEDRIQIVRLFLLDQLRGGREAHCIIDAHDASLMRGVISSLSEEERRRIHVVVNGIAKIGGDSASVGDSVWSNRGDIGLGVPIPYSPPAGDIEGQPNAFGRVVYRRTPGGLLMCILIHGVADTAENWFTYQFDPSNSTPGVNEISKVLAFANGDLGNADEFVELLNGYNLPWNVYVEALRKSRIIYPEDTPENRVLRQNYVIKLMTVLKPQGDSCYTVTAQTHTLQQPTVVFTGDQRLFFNCCKNNVSCVYVSPSANRYCYYRRTGGAEMGGGGLGLYNLFQEAADGISQGFLSFFKRSREDIRRQQEESDELKQRYSNLEGQVLSLEGYAASLKQGILEKINDIVAAPAREREMMRSQKNELERKRDPVVAKLAEIRAELALLRAEASAKGVVLSGGGGGGEKEDLDWIIDKHVRIVDAMSVYAANNLERLIDSSSSSALETLPDVLFHVMPIVTSSITIGIKDENGNYIDNPYIRMMVVDIFETLLQPCLDSREDTNMLVESFMWGSGYYLDEPIVDVVKSIMRGENAIETILRADFNGIDVISAHENAFKFMRPVPAVAAAVAAEAVEKAVSSKRAKPYSTPERLKKPVSAPMTEGSPEPGTETETEPEMGTGTRTAPASPVAVEPPPMKRFNLGFNFSDALDGGTRRQQRRRRRRQTRKKAERLGGLQATFEIVPHQP